MEASAAPKQKPTEYVILQAVIGPEGLSYLEVVGGVKDGKPKTASAATKQQAIKAMCTAMKIEGGTFIAVPVASFKPIAYEVEKKPVDKFADASL